MIILVVFWGYHHFRKHPYWFIFGPLTSTYQNWYLCQPSMNWPFLVHPGRSTAGTYSQRKEKDLNQTSRELWNPCTLLETNSKFAPENHWLEDVFFWWIGLFNRCDLFVSGSVLPSRNLTYPTWGKGKNYLQMCLKSGKPGDLVEDMPIVTPSHTRWAPSRSL